MNRKNDDHRGLPLRGEKRAPAPRPARRVILAAHLILTGYGHWLSNDPRGSGSTETRKDWLKELGEIHHGRKLVQPSRKGLSEFYQEAEPRLDHPVIWFSERVRRVIAEAVGRVAREHGY